MTGALPLLGYYPLARQFSALELGIGGSALALSEIYVAVETK